MNLIWFRNDLRLADNPALWHATEAGPAIGLFLICGEQWRSHDMAGCRAEFILRSLRRLRNDLNEIGIPLIVKDADSFKATGKIIAEICRDQNVSHVYWNNEYPLDEIKRDQAVEKVLKKHGVGAHRYHDRVLMPPGSVLKDDGEPYKVFTPFKRTLRQLLDTGAPDMFPPPQGQKAPEILESDLGAIPQSVDGFVSHIDKKHWPVGEERASSLLENFIEDHLEAYHEQRDIPAEQGTSSLSPYLAVGAISPQKCLAAAMSVPGEGVTTWIDELIWRDFYQHIVWHFPHVCRGRAFKEETDQLAWRTSGKDFERWSQGQTGVPLVDAGMAQLRETGWMHNRVRMVVAMFLSKNLLLDWRLGEAWFMEHLIDGDFPANNGGWQWSASTGTDAVPYFRIFNPFTQGKRFDPDAAYIKKFIPELEKLDAAVIHNPAKLQRELPNGYSGLMVDLGDSRKRALSAFKSL